MVPANDTPASVMGDSRGEWHVRGIALLCAYMAQKEEGESLADYSERRESFGGQGGGVTEDPVPADGKALTGF